MSNNKCAPYYFVKAEKLCGYNEDRVRACIGDGGSALSIKHAHHFIQIGIKSRDIKKMCKRRSLVMFTRITEHLNWIKNVSGIEYFSARRKENEVN